MAKERSTIDFEVKLWNPRHYLDRDTKMKSKVNAFDGIVRVPGQRDVHFHSPGALLTAIEARYWKEVRKKK